MSNEWISVEDRLPEYDGEYLVCVISDRMCVAFYDSIDEWHGLQGHLKRFVTHWMPLPSFPNE